MAYRAQELLDTLNDLEPLTGRNAVWLACDGGHEETAKLLISHGGDCHMSDAKGVSVFQIARLKCTPAFLAYIAEIVPEGEPCVCGVYDRGAPPSEPRCPSAAPSPARAPPSHRTPPPHRPRPSPFTPIQTTAPPPHSDSPLRD